MSTNKIMACDNGVLREFTAQELEQAQKDNASYPLFQASFVRQQRDHLLTASDWTQLPDSTADKAVWITYRQALRDISAQPGFPLEIVWPVPPA